MSGIRATLSSVLLAGAISRATGFCNANYDEVVATTWKNVGSTRIRIALNSEERKGDHHNPPTHKVLLPLFRNAFGNVKWEEKHVINLEPQAEAPLAMSKCVNALFHRLGDTETSHEVWIDKPGKIRCESSQNPPKCEYGNW